MPATAGDRGKRYPLNARTTKGIYQKLRAAAEINGRSLVQEVESRIEQSFHEDAHTPPEIRELTRVWEAAFLRGLGLGARARELRENLPAATLRDLFAFRTAAIAAHEAVLSMHPVEFRPDATPAEIAKWWEMLDLFARATARGGQVKVEGYDVQVEENEK
jgi:hypothetical protein